jgi:predicted AAA+ superfamily ATPase
MLSRALRLPETRSCLLLGPRQTGKSTLVRSTLPAAPRAWAVDLLESATYLRYAKDPGLFAAEAEEQIRRGARTIFVDEVQKLPGLLDEVHALVERHPARFLLTGSSARKLRRGGANLLAGRATVRRLHPLTFGEQGELFQLPRVLRFGSLPKVVTSSDGDARELLAAYAMTYLREEIQAEALVRNLGGFGRFLDVVAAQSGELLNASSLARDAGLAVRTVQEYVQILEDTLMAFRLEPWRKSPRARMVGHPKLYLFDTGVTNALCQRITADFDASATGKLFEQWVVLECLRAADYADTEARLFFWRTNTGAEVDLLVERHGELRVAIEIKHKKRIVGADLAGLRSFGEAEPGVPRVVVSLAPEPYRVGDVLVLPYAELFRRLPEWLGVK